MNAESIVTLALTCVVVWLLATVLHAAWMAADKRRDPLPPEPPEHHHADHGHDAGHGAEPAHGHGAAHH